MADIFCSACGKNKAVVRGYCIACYNSVYHPGKDLENKPLWAKRGIEKEWEFIHMICPSLGIKAAWNTEHIYEPDLYIDNKLAELKFKSVPFFKSFELFNILPQHCLSINDKDYVYYKESYPNLDIYFWVDWVELEKKIGDIVYAVRPMFGVYRVEFSFLA